MHYYKQCLESLAITQSTLVEYEELELKIDGNDQEIKIDTNHWVNGDFKLLEQHLNEIKQTLDSNDYEVPTSQLQEILQQIEKHQKTSSHLIGQAQNNFLNSIHRAELQLDIEEKLQGLGFQLEASCWAEDDERNAFHQILKDDQGNQLVTIVSPSEDKKELCHHELSINFYEAEQVSDEAKRTQYLSVIQDFLKNEGLDTTKPECDPKYQESAPQEFLNIEKIRKK
ncbi:MAG: hypothetical protein ACI86H_002118 [bacterium]|jgi:hypothetical protein